MDGGAVHPLTGVSGATHGYSDLATSLLSALRECYFGLEQPLPAKFQERGAALERLQKQSRAQSSLDQTRAGRSGAAPRTVSGPGFEVSSLEFRTCSDRPHPWQAAPWVGKFLTALPEHILSRAVLGRCCTRLLFALCE